MRVRAVLSTVLLLGSAAAPSVAQDRLRIQGIADGASVVVMIRNAGDCKKDLVFRSSGETVLGNVLPPSGGCISEIAIFSEGNAMLLESPVNTWTNGVGDIHTAILKPVIDVPVSIWVKDDATAAKARIHLDNANDLYRKNRVGVRFAPAIRKVSDVSTDSSAFAIISNGIRRTENDLECQNLGAIEGREFHTRDALNVYYVDDGFTGRNCAILATPPVCTRDATAFPRGDGNITFLGSGATSTTLAHEFGHAFGLRPRDCGAHTDIVPGFDEKNIMFPQGGDERVSFSLGQVFRMNTQRDGWDGTMLIKNRLRPGPGRECPLNLPRSDMCPSLAEKWPN